MSYLIIVVLLVGVVLLVSGPLRRRPAVQLHGSEAQEGEAREAELRSLQRIDLEAARDAKYREIRDAELDHQTGKLSDDDFAAIDSTLRAEAVELLHRLDELDESRDAPSRED